MEYFVHIWNSEGSMWNIVTVLDYAGIVDTIAGIILLFIWLRKKESEDRMLGLIAILCSIAAGVLWTVDAKCGHQLSILQQMQSEKMYEAQSNRIKRTEDRTITKEQIEKFENLLKNSKKGRIVVWISFASGGDAGTYAEKIRAMISAAGYDTGNGIAVGFDSSGHPKGVLVEFRDAETKPIFFEDIFNALNAVGIDAQRAIDPGVGSGFLSPGEMAIFIGEKP